MHTAHIALIKADSHQDAIDRVSLYLYGDEGSFASEWSDWSAIGADSRYSFSADYPNWSGENDYAVSLDTEPELFDKVFWDFYGYRVEAYKRYRDELVKEGKTNILDFPLDSNSMTSWQLFRLSELVTGVYCSDSHVYDLEHMTASVSLFSKTRDSGGWYAVLIDFHY